jgi:hypothetical protein
MEGAQIGIWSLTPTRLLEAYQGSGWADAIPLMRHNPQLMPGVKQLGATPKKLCFLNTV